MLKFTWMNILIFSLLLPGAAEAFAQVDVIVHPSNSSAMDQQYVKNIFLSKIRLYPSGTGAKPLDLPESDEVRGAFYASLVGKTEMEMKLYWSTTIFTGAGSPPKIVESERAMMKFVSENSNAIGYLRRGVADKSVKILFTLD